MNWMMSGQPSVGGVVGGLLRRLLRWPSCARYGLKHRRPAVVEEPSDSGCRILLSSAVCARKGVRCSFNAVKQRTAFFAGNSSSREYQALPPHGTAQHFDDRLSNSNLQETHVGKKYLRPLP